MNTKRDNKDLPSQMDCHHYHFKGFMETYIYPDIVVLCLSAYLMNVSFAFRRPKVMLNLLGTLVDCTLGKIFTS